MGSEMCIRDSIYTWAKPKVEHIHKKLVEMLEAEEATDKVTVDFYHGGWQVHQQ